MREATGQITMDCWILLTYGRTNIVVMAPRDEGECAT